MKYYTKLFDYLINSAKLFPNKAALICNKKEYTYHDINDFSDKVANYLLLSGIKRGDRVVVCLENSMESIIIFWGVLKAGGIISLIDCNIKNDKITYILKDATPFAFVCKKEKSLQLQKLLSNNTIKNIIVDEEKSLKEILVEKNESDGVKVLDIDLASIIYTSGSTGEPKGVMLTHHNMIAALNSINEYLYYQPNDIVISTLPISFDYGLYQMIIAFSVGATLILEKSFLFPAQLLKKIYDYKATIIPVVPTMIKLIEKHQKKFHYDLSSIRLITNTGEALNSKHIEIIKEIFPLSKIFSMYGLTECKRCSYLPPEMIDKKPKSIGIAIPNTELWIVDNNGNSLGQNQIGELVVRGSTVMKGYWNKPNETTKKLKDGIIPGEKILYTGDYCWFDEDNYLYFYGRSDELIKCRGIKISPKEIEEKLLLLKGIKESVVIGYDDLEIGVMICAFLACDESISETLVRKYCIENLSSEKRPQLIFLLQNLPKTANGKIDKLSLKQLAKNKIKSQPRQNSCVNHE